MGVKNVLAMLRRAHPADSALSSVAGGGAGDEARARLDAHIAACPRCSARLAEYRALRVALAGLDAEDAPRSFRVAPGQALALPPERMREPARRGNALVLRAMPALAVAAAVVFAALIGLDVLGGGNGGSADRLAAVRATSPEAATGGASEKALAPAPSSAQAPEDSSNTAGGSVPPGSPPAGGAVADSASNATRSPGAELYAASGTPAAPALAPRSAGTSATPAASTPVQGNAPASGAIVTPEGASTVEAAPTGGNESGGGVGAMRWAEIGAGAIALLAMAAAVVAWRRREEGP